MQFRFMTHRRRDDFVVLFLILSGSFSLAFPNLSIKKDCLTICEIRSNGTLWFSNGYKENQTDAVESGELVFKKGTTKLMWTKLNKEVHFGKTLHTLSALPGTGLRFINTPDDDYPNQKVPVAELSSVGDLYCIDGIFMLTVEEIRFNWNNSSYANDALNLRFDGYNGVQVPEFMKGIQSLPAAYVGGTDVVIKVKFKVQPSWITSLDIQGVSNDADEGCLGSTSVQTVSFTGGLSGQIAFDAGTTPVDVWVGSDSWDWTADDGQTVVKTDRTTTRVYNTLQVPLAPWNQTVGSIQNPWARVLAYACTWAKGNDWGDDIVAGITVGAYNNFPVTYNGGPSHTNGQECNLTALLNEDFADCRDMSAVVQLFSQALGVTGVQVKSVSYYDFEDFFLYKPLLPIGTTQWTSGMWLYHQFGWYNGRVYDGAVKLNQFMPRNPIDEDVNGSYKADLLDVGDWLLDPASQINSVY